MKPEISGQDNPEPQIEDFQHRDDAVQEWEKIYNKPTASWRKVLDVFERATKIRARWIVLGAFGIAGAIGVYYHFDNANHPTKEIPVQPANETNNTVDPDCINRHLAGIPHQDITGSDIYKAAEQCKQESAGQIIDSLNSASDH